MQHLVVERWSRSSSALHRIDARAKVLALIVLLVAIATTPASDRAVFLAFAALLGCVVLVARLPVVGVIMRAAWVLPFTGWLAAISWLSGDHARAVALLERSILSAFAVLLLVSTTPLPRILSALESLYVPNALVLVLQFLYRYLFVVADQAQRMRMAAKCRQGHQKGLDGFRAAAGSIGVLFARSWERAEGIHRAMQARGFHGTFPSLSRSNFRWQDAAFVVSAGVLAVAIRVGLSSTRVFPGL